MKTVCAIHMGLSMKYVEPMRVNGFWATSQTMIEEEMIERKFFLGYFISSINVKDVEDIISRKKLYLRIFTSGGRGSIICIPGKITHGVVFETLEEFTENLKNNVTYEDINHIYKEMNQWKS